MTDSIITSWENYYKENNLNTYLSIELLEMNKTIVNDSYTGMSSLNATVHLKVTPLKGRIDKLSVGFTFFRTNEVPPYKLIDRVAGGTINTEEAFSKAIEVSSELNVTSRDLPGWTRSYVDYISQTSSESFKKECKIDMDITCLLYTSDAADEL